MEADNLPVRDDPANKKNLDFPPALMEAIRDDPAALQPPARVMAVTLLHEQFVESKGYTPAQKLALTEALARFGNLQPKEKQAAQTGAGYKLIINLGDATEMHRGITIEQQPQDIIDANI